jgi:sulfide:quinone oxidoreductase
MATDVAPKDTPHVVVVGGGVAALETVLALKDLARDRVAMTVVAPAEEFVYRPMTVREPFSYAAAKRYPLAPIMHDLGVELIAERLGWVDRERQVLHTAEEHEIHYDELVLALGGQVYSRYKHAITIDDRRMDEVLHGLIQDIEGGYLDSVAFLAPGRMAWQLPLYELALMTAGRAFDMDVKVDLTIVTPEERPLAIFGSAVSDNVSELLRKAGIRTINSAYAEVPSPNEIVINPGDRRLHAKRIVALPELYGPSVRGVPVSEHGFIRVDRFGRVFDAAHVFAAGDAVDFPIKHGGLSAQQADAVAESIAAAAGAEVEPQPFEPVIRGMLLTDGKPRYLTARITGGHGFSSEFSETPTWSPPSKIVARYLAPYLDALDHASGRLSAAAAGGAARA